LSNLAERRAVNAFIEEPYSPKRHWLAVIGKVGMRLRVGKEQLKFVIRRSTDIWTYSCIIDTAV